MNRLIALIRRKPAPPVKPLEQMLAVRGLRLNNRDRDAAARYVRLHVVLAEGRKA